MMSKETIMMTLMMSKINGLETFKDETQEVRESYLKPFFNLMYYLLFIPFKVDTLEVSGEYVLKSNKFQKVACAIIYLELVVATVLYYTWNDARLFYMTYDISQLLHTVGNIFGSMMAFYTTKSVWFHQKSILQFLNASRVNSFPRHGMSLTRMKFLVVSMSICMCIVQAAFALWLDTTLQFPSMEDAFQRIRESYGGMILYAIWSYSARLFFAQGTALYMMPRLLLCVLLLQLKGLGLQFERFLEKQETMMLSPVEKVMDEYEKLRETVECANSWAGGILLSVCICVLSFLATLPGIFRDKSEAQIGKWGHILYSTMIGIFLFVACDLPRRTRTAYRRWAISKRRQAGLSLDDKLMLIAVSQEADYGEPVGLSCTFFTITYHFFGSMIGLLTTYGVIVFQMHK